MELSGQVVLSEKEKHEILKELIADERERNKTDREFFNGGTQSAIRCNKEL